MLNVLNVANKKVGREVNENIGEKKEIRAHQRITAKSYQLELKYIELLTRLVPCK